MAFGRTATELEETLPEREWQEWLMFQETEPVGLEREDWRIAVITSLFANAKRGPHSPVFEASEFTFMPELRDRVREPRAEEAIIDMARAWGAI